MSNCIKRLIETSVTLAGTAALVVIASARWEPINALSILIASV
nr:hypothetical protein [uncultured Sphingomonas sp.]